MVNKEIYQEIRQELDARDVQLVAVSKTKPVADIQALYALGQRAFGENYVQELLEKQPQLPADIEWHFIGHLQSNKVKYIAAFVEYIHAVDSFKLLLEINKQASRHNRVIKVLLQVYIAQEESKFGMNEKELFECLEYYEAQKDALNNIEIAGVMGMASFTEDRQQVSKEFATLYNIFLHLKQTFFLGTNVFNVCSMGMSGDYKIAVTAGSTMVRIGSLLFGNRS